MSRSKGRGQASGSSKNDTTVSSEKLSTEHAVAGGEEELDAQLLVAKTVKEDIQKLNYPFVSSVSIEIFESTLERKKRPLVVVAINRSLSDQERALIPQYSNNIRIVAEYVEEVETIPDDIKQEMTKKENDKDDEDSSSDEEGEEGGGGGEGEAQEMEV